MQMPVDSTSVRPLADLDAKPLVTVCNNELEKKFNDSGVDDTMEYLAGETQSEKVLDLYFINLIHFREISEGQHHLEYQRSFISSNSSKITIS